MRWAGLLIVLASLLWARSAQADVTAHYYVWGPLGPSMSIAVADNGDARIQIRGKTVAIRRGGVDYLVRGDASGPFVLRADEFARIEARKLREHGGLPGVPDTASARIVEYGIETVGGREGRILQLEEEGKASSDTHFAFVVNSDSDLAPVGPLVAMLFGAKSHDIDPALDLFRDVTSRGTLIRMAFMLRLERTSDQPIAPAAFALPGPEVSGEEAERRLGRAW
jgi:hypothetical protein